MQDGKNALTASLVLGFAWAHGHALVMRPAALPSLDLARPVAAAARLADIQAGRIDVVVVYKIDRLSRDVSRKYRDIPEVQV